jgi:hypothetical protein
MSRAELKSIIDRSSAGDRLFLAAYLQYLSARDDISVSRELAEAHDKIAKGRKLGLAGRKRLHTSWSAPIWEDRAPRRRCAGVTTRGIPRAA